MRYANPIILAIASLMLTSCAASMQNKLRQVASYDLSCPEQDLTLTKLSGSWAWVGVQAGVDGCNKKGRYIFVEGVGWVAN